MNQPLRRRASRISAASILFLLLGFIAGGAPAVADEKPLVAEITDYEISPIDVDVSNGPVDVTVTLTLTDNASEESPWLTFVPGYTEVNYLGFEMELVEGTERDGTWKTVVTFDENAMSLEWLVFLHGLNADPEDYEGIGLGSINVTGSVDDADGGPGIVTLPSDIRYTDWYFAPVFWMVASEITTGYKDGTFKPAKPVTRGEAVTFLYRYADEDFTVPATATLKDVPVTHNQFEAISWATANKVVNGYSNGEFRSGKNMTRGEVAAILYRQAKPTFTAPAKTGLKDLVQGKTTHYEAIAWMVSEGITTGRANGTFDPSAQVTRAEFATFLYRYDGVLTN